MAVTAIVEKGSGDANSFSQPVYVYDPAGGSVSIVQAKVAAEGAAPAVVLGTSQDGNPVVEVLADNVYRVTVRYTSSNDFVFLAQTSREEYTARAETLELAYAPQIARFPGTAPDFKGVMHPYGKDGPVGASIQPGVETCANHLRMNITTFTPAYRKFVMNAVRAGAVNQFLIAGYQPGELQVVSFTATKVNTVDYQVRVGWSYKPNVPVTTIAGIPGVTHAGHDYVWHWLEPAADRNNNTIYQKPKFIYVNRPRPLLNFATLQVTPPPIA